jgi:membrane protease YdiL (CAAX protease family)
VVERRSWRNGVGTILVVLVVANVMSNRLLPAALYVPWNLAVAGVLIWIARRDVSDAELGFSEWRRGAAFGLTLLFVTAGVMLVAVAMPVFHDLYRDRRVGTDLTTLVWQAGVRIPFGTVVLEEVAFRAVLPAMFAVRHGVLRGCLMASALFGLWHVLPAWSLNRINPTATRIFGTGFAGTSVAVVVAVIGTTVAGLWWCWIRYRARSVLSTMIAHVATNSVGYLIAYFVVR